MNKNMQNMRNITDARNKMTNLQNVKLLNSRHAGKALTKLLALFAFSLSLSFSTNCLASDAASNTSNIEPTEQNLASNFASEGPFIENLEEESKKARDNWENLCDAERLNVIKRFAEHYNEIEKNTYRKPMEVKVNPGN
jgi:hypothetical protein